LKDFRRETASRTAGSAMQNNGEKAATIVGTPESGTSTTISMPCADRSCPRIELATEPPTP
jgi:hypothetical protein